MIPIKIKVEKENLFIVWNDELASTIKLTYLRDECPCAGCKGETILFRNYRPPKLTMAHPEMYKKKAIEMVGEYAIKISWKDEHTTGIYTWDYLKQLEKDQETNNRQNYKPLL